MSPRRAPATPASTTNRRVRRRDDEVMAAAVRVFHERGYSDATVQDLADELGILKGSVYHYIDTKEDLLYRLLETVHQDVGEILDRVSDAEGLDALGRLELYVRSQVAYNLDHIERISVYYHDWDRLTGERREAIVAQRRRHERFVTRLIEEAQQAGTADSTLDAQLLSNCVFAAVIWTYRWYRPSGPAKRETIADLCSRFALRGIVGEPGAGARRSGERKA